MLLWILAAACRPTSGAADALGETLPDFSLVDQNPTSERYGEAVSPQDYREGMASAWYFGHAS